MGLHISRDPSDEGCCVQWEAKSTALHACEHGEVAFGGQAMNSGDLCRQQQKQEPGMAARHCGKGRNAENGCFGRVPGSSAKAISMGKGSRCIITNGDMAGWGAWGRRLA